MPGADEDKREHGSVLSDLWRERAMVRPVPRAGSAQ